MFAAVLKEHTHTAHIELEKSLVSVIKSIRTSQDYTTLLALLYGFYKPVEDAVHAHVNQQAIPFYSQRRKAEALLDDIAYITPGQPLPALCNNIPAIQSHASALGAMYVLEGSTLGGKIIAGMIAKQLRLPPGESTSFFSSYGSGAETMWASFKDVLNAPSTPEDQQTMLQAAQDTFVTFKTWVDAQPKSL